ncbi:MAG: S9 family peptidase [Ignavibacteria bacterium]|nr:S9 family peptidase [Ignavibacteria bacterium]
MSKAIQLAVALLFFILPVTNTFSQELTFDYIFQDTNIINPRPSLKFINTASSKIYYYADDDFDGTLSTFDQNYITGETYKYSDTGDSPSEYVILPNGNALSVIKGEVYLSRNFTTSREFSRDLQLTFTDEYEYSPEVIGNFAIYRRSGNYYMVRYDSLKSLTKEIPLTNDESDSISYQLISYYYNFPDTSKTVLRLAFARYDNSSKHDVIFPDYNDIYVKVGKQKRGYSKVKLLEMEIRIAGKDSLARIVNEITYPDSIRYSTNSAIYSPDGEELIFDVETLNRKTRKIFSYNITNKGIEEIYTESDSAWYERHNNSTRFVNDDEILFESEVSGYNNLYCIKKDGSGFRKLAGGEYTITESAFDRKNGIIYFAANKEHPYEYFIYKTDLSGSPPVQLTSDSGDVEELILSDDGKYLFYQQSYINKPDELYQLDLESVTSRRITFTISPKFSEINWRIPELITFQNEEDAQTIYAFVYKPKDYDPKKKYPLICFAHGAGYLQNVTYGFSPYRDNFMTNTFLTDQGFIVLDVDYRGSMGYGRDFRTKTYENMGYWEVSDYISGVNYLSSQGIINKNKVGIYGGSYGGFITLMAMFQHGEVFKCGVALRAVASWLNYYRSNKWFIVSRLGDLDKDDVEDIYKNSSPVTYAAGLSGPLLLTHGMLDDNVFFQDMVQLTQKLIDLKKDFEVMIYPKENHSFYKQTSWLDQYKRIWKFFEKNLK